LFYGPFESLLREMLRRMIRKDYDREEPGGEYIAELHKRNPHIRDDGKLDQASRIVKLSWTP
jgi:hypothetical protein